jgi:hypothetical protein
MASIMVQAAVEMLVIKCRIAKTAELKMRERKSVSTVENPYMTHVVGALVTTAATDLVASNAIKRNALASPMAVPSSEYSSVSLFSFSEWRRSFL